MSVKIALAGNPNCGKTTLFNTLTGSNQYVGNWPGVTVEKKEGILKGHPDVVVMDLPGIYSLSPYTPEEVVARKYLIFERPDVILNIIDGTNIERNLYLTTQLVELGIPVVVAINMMDVVDKRGDRINSKALSEFLGGCKIFEVSALKSNGIEAAANYAVSLARTDNTKMPEKPFLFDSKLEDALDKISERIDCVPDEIMRFVSIKLFERDLRIKNSYNNMPDVEDIIKRSEKTYNDDSESIVTTERYAYITSIIKKCVVRNADSDNTTSDKIDAFLTNKYLAIPIFAIIMFLVYYISITKLGAYGTDWLSDGVFGDGWSLFGFFIPGIPVLVENFLEYFGTADWMKSLIVDGMISGVGAVLGFVPQLMILFICLAFMEACGYMSRVAFIMDGIFRKFGLSGKSFIPIIIGTGCGVPGIMASRTIENPSDRRMTIITTTFIPCGAKLPMIALFAGAFFGGAWWVAPLAYLVGIGAIVLSGIILKKSRPFKSNETPFVMELPPYHMPTLINVLKSMWERSWSFIKKAGTVILISTVVIWFLSNLGFENGKFGFVSDLSYGILSYIGRGISWIFIPLGFDHWQSAVAVLTGLIAKENVVSTLAVLYGGAEGVSTAGSIAMHFTTASAFSFMTFNLLCAPCCAAMAAIGREMNSKKWTAFAILYQTGFAYLTSLCIYQIWNFIVSGICGFWTIISIVVIIVTILALFLPKKD